MTREIDEYVAELGRALRGPRRTRADLVTEAADSLTDAADAYEAAGLNRSAAECRAVADFGTVAEIAPAYQVELTVAQSRRASRILLAVMAIQPLVWQSWWPWWDDTAAAESGTAYAVANDAVEWLGGAAMLASLTAVVLLGIGSRYVDPGRTREIVRWVGVGALVVCGLVAGLGLTMCVLNPTETMLMSLLWLTPVLLVPLAFVAAAARACLRLR